MIRIILWAVFLSLFSCGSDPELTSEMLIRRLEELEPDLKLRAFLLPSSDSFSLIPQDSLNPVNALKVNLGRLLFFDPAISFDPKCKAASKTFSCASCHFAEAGFQAGLKQSIAGGGRGYGYLRHKHPLCDSMDLDVQMIRTPSILNVAYQEVQLWSGKIGGQGMNAGLDSLWRGDAFLSLNQLGMSGVETQARIALEAHGMRMSPELLLETNYKQLFDETFPNEKDDLRYRRFSMAKAIAAFERTVMANKSAWQNWLRGDTISLDKSQLHGAWLFIGKAACYRCHSGPALNSMSFHALGMNDMEGPDIIRKDSSNRHRLGRAEFTKRAEDLYKFKTPQIYNLKDVEYLGHGGSFCSVEEVVRYKNLAIPQKKSISKQYLSPLFQPLGLTEKEIKDLVNFIENALWDPDLTRYQPAKLPSGLCFPNADRMSKEQLNCL
ncbi:MAG: cytochrome-c peroxidase [Saprospiraceae bacterium]|nr:cytochrome-c peroxidase [Saprospiraceae bacterium]